MSAEAILGDFGKGESVNKHGRERVRRWAACAAGLGLALLLVGDGPRAATVPAAIYGQDPLEVLELKVKPNVIIVLDSSGSMKFAPDPSLDGGEVIGTMPNSSDHPRSRLWQAKQVLRDVVSANQNDVSFMFGRYTQAGSNEWSMRNLTTTNTSATGVNRFQYWTSSAEEPCMDGSATTPCAAPSVDGELSAQRAYGDSSTTNRGLQSWQVIYPQRGATPGWNTYYYQENNTTGTCVAVIPNGTVPTGERFFARGGKALTTNPDVAGSFAAVLKTQINSPTGCSNRGATPNSYDVTYDGGTGRFTIHRTGGSRTWRPLWSAAVARPNSIRAAVNALTTPANLGAGPFSTGTPYTLLFRDTSTTEIDPLGSCPQNALLCYQRYMNKWSEQKFGQGTVTNYQFRTQRFFNGETLQVNGAGDVCDMTFPAAADRTRPASMKVQRMSDDCGTAVGSPVTFKFGGTFFYDSDQESTYCNGYQKVVDLVPCDLKSPPAQFQIDTIGPFLEDEFQLNADGTPAYYTEAQDGTWSALTSPTYWQGGIKAYGGTPIANSLVSVRTIFTDLWTDGQAGSQTSAGAPPYEISPISGHVDPKEKTLVIVVTDGNESCSGSGATGALTAAYRAEQLYAPILAGDMASSVETFVVGYGAAVTPDYMNWIAWGGSGLGQDTPGQPNVTLSGSQWNESATSLATKRGNCTTCRDAYLAPDAETLRDTLQRILNRGASDGDFSAAQSITESLFEYVDRASDSTNAYDALAPSTRYRAITPTRFITSFSLPGFKGQLKAYQNDGAGNSILKWSAGEKLNAIVRAGFTAGNCPAIYGSTAGTECLFRHLHGGLGYDPPDTDAAIKRRIYTTAGNGVFTYDAETLIDGDHDGRVNLWPPQDSAMVPDDLSQGTLDAALGLPLDSTTQAQADFVALQAGYDACTGENLPLGCTAMSGAIPDWSTRMRTARREAREMIFAFTAGAKPAMGSTGIRRTIAGTSVDHRRILYNYRDWVLADTELATAAVVTQPLPSEPVATSYLPEYRLFRDGARDGNGKNPESTSD